MEQNRNPDHRPECPVNKKCIYVYITVPVCPHAGGVGLCELVQHLQAFDYIALSGTKENR